MVKKAHKKDLQWEKDRPCIHALKNDAIKNKPGFTEDDYRNIILDVSGGRTDSSKECTPAERRDLIERLKDVTGDRRPGRVQNGQKGRKRNSYPGRPRNMEAGDRAALLGKIEAQLTEAGRAWAYADGIARNMFKVDKVAWCKPEQLQKIVAALTYDAKRHGRRIR